MRNDDNMFDLIYLTNVEVYEYYDQPVLYSGMIGDNYFLVLATGENEWLVTNMDEYHLHMLHMGYIDFYECFRCGCYSYLFNTGNDYHVKVTYYKGHQVPEELLPEKGEYL